MNNPTPIILPSAMPALLDENQQDCVTKLREALEQAEAGKVLTCGIVLCFKSGYASTIAGYDAGSLNLGCDSLKKKILANVEEPAPWEQIIKRPQRAQS
jgi:hypothetical protein